MLILTVKVTTSLEEEEMTRIANERKPDFAAIPGLVQMYYVKHSEPNTYGGVYLWDSQASLHSYRLSELAASVATAYKATSPPEVTVAEVMDVLRG